MSILKIILVIANPEDASIKVQFNYSTLNRDQLIQKVTELQIIRDENNKEMIKLESDIQTEKARNDKIMQERDILIEAMNDLQNVSKIIKFTSISDIECVQRDER